MTPHITGEYETSDGEETFIVSEYDDGEIIFVPTNLDE
jgi:hypothetical protein|tara:strand:+ start:30 stop:143 length:114 start_codon:yes stop_codon:yes gene_type:complete